MPLLLLLFLLPRPPPLRKVIHMNVLYSVDECSGFETRSVGRNKHDLFNMSNYCISNILNYIAHCNPTLPCKVS